MSEPRLQLSHSDILALIAHQSSVVGSIAQGIARGQVGPSDLVASTNRLSEMVSTWITSIPPAQKADNDKAA